MGDSNCHDLIHADNHPHYLHNNIVSFFILQLPSLFVSLPLLYLLLLPSHLSFLFSLSLSLLLPLSLSLSLSLSPSPSLLWLAKISSLTFSLQSCYLQNLSLSLCRFDRQLCIYEIPSSPIGPRIKPVMM